VATYSDYTYTIIIFCILKIKKALLVVEATSAFHFSLFLLPIFLLENAAQFTEPADYMTNFKEPVQYLILFNLIRTEEGGCNRKIHCEELHNLCSSPNIIKVEK
jgi:hypothetical protein